MIGIIDYEMGNLASVQKALTFLKAESVISSDPVELNNCKYLILPGVGSYYEAMQNIHSKNLTNFIKHSTLDQKKPFLGICLGMQLLSQMGTEDTKCEGLGLIEGTVELIPDHGLPIPHIGWNNIYIEQESPIFNDIKILDFYFVHSYYFKASKLENILASTEYGKKITAMVKKDNILGAQFHPEKSQDSGLQLLKNFLDIYA